MLFIQISNYGLNWINNYTYFYFTNLILLYTSWVWCTSGGAQPGNPKAFMNVVDGGWLGVLFESKHAQAWVGLGCAILSVQN